jgi:hypothetical protein
MVQGGACPSSRLCSSQADTTTNLIAANKLAANRVVANRIVLNGISPAVPAGEGAVADILSIELPDGTNLTR